MKKYILWAFFFLLSTSVAACGAKEEADDGTKDRKEETNEDLEESIWQGGTSREGLTALAERTEYYDLTVMQEELFALGLWEKNVHEEYIFTVIHSGGTAYLPMGSQFYQGEPVQIWAEVTSEGSDIYLYRKDGSGELVLEDVPGDYTSADFKCGWYIDREGDFYCRFESYPQVNGEYKMQGSCVKILSSGEILPANEMEIGITIDDFCQTEDGRMYLLLWDHEKNIRYLEELDTVSGLCISESRIEVPMQFQVYLGEAGDYPAVTGYSMEDINRRILKLNPKDGRTALIVSFTGTTYQLRDNLELQDFRVLEDDSIELLWTESNGTGGLLERLKMEKVEKIPIVLRGVFWHDSWLMDKISRFNSQNSTYHVIMEDCWDGREQDEFFRLTSVQIGAGKGPDILCGNQLPQGYIGGMLEKGTLEDLAPYMEASGILEEDYFPLTFAVWRQGAKIYGVNPRMSIWSEEIEESILGNRQIPDIETLVNALLIQERDGVYYEGWDSAQVLKSFLQGTDSLWGMVDWESGTCDFNTPLFGNLLEAASRYGDDGRKNPESTVMHKRSLSGVVYFSGQAEQEAEERVSSGVLFDDGCYAACLPQYTLAINANSAHKEGAWEFIRFLLDEESQSMDFVWYEPPVNRKAFEIWMQESIVALTEVKYENGAGIYPAYYGTDVSEEKQAEYRKTLEEVRPLPMRTEPIIEIILEEAKDYFSGYKSAEEISRIVGNRVQLYLDE